ncbi:MAG TPA: triphosphoribosyl-dephospho-CoA synthase [Gemmatimonadales bacterium]|nr:triphosphoribosyl-dephospho-CoA synthase [Gemmatimonadales bacterium]
MIQAEDVAIAGQLACLLEVTAPKPGNVSPSRHFHDTRFEDFLVSAAAIGPALAGAGERALGPTILAAVEATTRWTRSNTNLGIILLLAPLARAALRSDRPLREGLRETLDATTVTDSADVYAAIRRARPGGLGAAAREDVAAAPTLTLVAAMALAADRDTVAREYATGFETTFEIGARAVMEARAAGLDWSDATVEAYLRLLSSIPDTHIARKLGRPAAEEVTRRARAVVDAGGVRSEQGRRALEALDAELRDATNSRNPGTTADLTCAALFVVILEQRRNP